MIYAGIGSRETPCDIFLRMQDWGRYFAQNGYVLRSGHARGSDQAFEYGCDMALAGDKAKQIFTADMSFRNPQWFDHAAKFHPAWDRCSSFAKALHARNSAIVLGSELNDPVKLVVCWTKDGKASGGTGQALRIAEHHQIPIFNLHDEQAEQRLREWLS